jgi:hypothetical protein
MPTFAADAVVDAPAIAPAVTPSAAIVVRMRFIDFTSPLETPVDNVLPDGKFRTIQPF